MTRFGVLSNPGSRKNKRGLDDLHAVLDGRADARHVVLDTIAQVPGILADFAEDGVEVVVVAGGDGTVQAALTEYYGRRSFDVVPLLAIAPRGTANMIAAEVGLRSGAAAKRGLAGLLRLLVSSRDELEAACTTRRVLRVENALNVGPQCGMFLGGAGFCRAVETWRNKVAPLQLNPRIAETLTLARLLGNWMFGSAGKHDPVFYGDRITLRIDQGPPVSGETLLFLATTLNRLMFNSRPFWGGDPGSTGGHLRFTEIAYPPERLLRYARRLLYGSEDRRLPETSYHSWSPRRVEIEMDCPFALDGELFHPTPGRPLVLTAADEARFVRM